MSTNQQQFSDLPTATRTAQIICGALMAGVLMFGLIAIFVGQGEQADANPIIGYIAAGMAVMAVLARMIVPGFLVATQRKAIRQLDPELRLPPLLGLYLTRTIIGMALPEGAAFFCLVAYMMTSQWWLLAIVGSLLALMAINFPSQSAVEAFVQEQNALIEADI